MPEKPTDAQIDKLRSRAWFNNPANTDMTALYLERTMNYGLTLDELQSGRPIMAAATVDIPAIVLSGGPMLNGWFHGKRTGSGTILWTAREMMARGEINA